MATAAASTADGCCCRCCLVIITLLSVQHGHVTFSVKASVQFPQLIRDSAAVAAPVTFTGIEIGIGIEKL